MAMWNNQMVNPNLHRAEFVWFFLGFSTKNRWLIMISWHGESSIYGHLISNVSTELWPSSMLMGFSILIHPAVVPPFMEVLNPFNDHFFLVVNYCGWLWNPSPADRWFIPLYIQYWINVIYRLQLFAVYIVDKYFCLIWILPPQFLIDMNIPNDLATIHSINIHRWSPRQPRGLARPRTGSNAERPGRRSSSPFRREVDIRRRIEGYGWFDMTSGYPLVN